MKTIVIVVCVFLATAPLAAEAGVFSFLRRPRVQARPVQPKVGYWPDDPWLPGPKPRASCYTDPLTGRTVCPLQQKPK